MLSSADTIRAVETIESIIENAGYGWVNQTALRGIEAELFSLKIRRSDPYIAEKLGIIESRMRDLLQSAQSRQMGRVRAGEAGNHDSLPKPKRPCSNHGTGGI